MPAIYVGTYARYNQGSLHGAWIDLDKYSDKDSFWERVHEVHVAELKATGEIEAMNQDWENIPKGLVGESHIDDLLWEWLELDEEDRLKFELYRSHVNQEGSILESREAFYGHYDSEEDWAEEYLGETGALAEMPDHLRGYIDFKSYARDAKHEGWSFVRHEGRLWAFRNDL